MAGTTQAHGSSAAWQHGGKAFEGGGILASDLDDVAQQLVSRKLTYLLL